MKSSSNPKRVGKCPRGMIINPYTNRCIKKDGPTAKRLGLTKENTKEPRPYKTRYDHEGKMIYNQLMTMKKNIRTILPWTHPSSEFPSWVQSKLSVANANLTSVADYLSHSH